MTYDRQDEQYPFPHRNNYPPASSSDAPLPSMMIPGTDMGMAGGGWDATSMLGFPSPPPMAAQAPAPPISSSPSSMIPPAAAAPGNLTTESSSSSITATETTKEYHPEWGVMREQEFHPLTLKHQRDLENLYQSGTSMSDFYFWQANLGGYCMADMTQNMVVSSEGVFPLVRRMVEGAPHPGRRKKKRGMG